LHDGCFEQALDDVKKLIGGAKAIVLAVLKKFKKKKKTTKKNLPVCYQ
jgi:hypothetical protein